MRRAVLERLTPLPVAELARHVGLSAPSVAERMRRLEDRGILRALVKPSGTDAGALIFVCRLRPPAFAGCAGKRRAMRCRREPGKP